MYRPRHAWTDAALADRLRHPRDARLGARTGYEIKSIVDRSTRFFWAASYGQIYPELRRLEAAGLVKGKLVRPAAASARSTRLTKRRRAGSSEWGPGRRRSRSCATRACSSCSSRTRSRSSRRSSSCACGALGHEQFLALLREIEARPGDDPPFVGLVLRYGIDYAEFNIEWCKPLRRRRLVEKKGGGMTVAGTRTRPVEGRASWACPEPNFRSIFLAGAPRFAREAFGPVAGFLRRRTSSWGLTVGIVLATVVGAGDRGVRAQAWTSAARSRSSPSAFVVLQGSGRARRRQRGRLSRATRAS